MVVSREPGGFVEQVEGSCFIHVLYCIGQGKEVIQQAKEWADQLVPAGDQNASGTE